MRKLKPDYWYEKILDKKNDFSLEPFFGSIVYLLFRIVFLSITLSITVLIFVGLIWILELIILRDFLDGIIILSLKLLNSILDFIFSFKGFVSISLIIIIILLINISKSSQK